METIKKEQRTNNDQSTSARGTMEGARIHGGYLTSGLILKGCQKTRRFDSRLIRVFLKQYQFEKSPIMCMPH